MNDRDHSTPGVDLVRAERLRQITDEGHTPEHDLDHSVDDLVLASLTYLLGMPELWPWEPETFKPTGPINENTLRDLVKAGALVVAAIDRLVADQKDN